ncbi:hypothetical protein BpHYR1_035455 [Brachionus plicatilis]|uniref:Uncharacterized protein n=1 Tax=Brachionus plicatilis TaxID=10195 RepID=A0A3M7SRQ4_BRAPC|nr:hypothetical protein BpHYR1_035455 [Brachionus plicatilis]
MLGIIFSYCLLALFTFDFLFLDFKIGHFVELYHFGVFSIKVGKKKVSVTQRWQLIGLLKDKTKFQQEIADLVAVSRKCVITTKPNYEKTSVVKELPRSARPQKLSSRDESYIFRELRINLTTSYRQLASDFSSKFPNVLDAAPFIQAESINLCTWTLWKISYYHQPRYFLIRLYKDTLIKLKFCGYLYRFHFLDLLQIS